MRSADAGGLVFSFEPSTEVSPLTDPGRPRTAHNAARSLDGVSEAKGGIMFV